MNEENFLPFALPSLSEDEIEEVVDSLRSGWWTTGPKTRRFETEFAEFVGAKYAVAVNSATAGLHLALESIGLKRRDKVITTAYTFTSTAEVVRYFDADPVFVDIDERSLNLSIPGLRDALQRETGVKAIIPVHFAGQPCEMDSIHDLAAEYGVKVIEDAAHAFPAEYKGRMVGTLSDLTVYSFYVTKTIATGEGGMVVTDDEDLANRIKVMRLHGISRDVFNRYTSEKPSWYYEVIAPGYKYNMPDIAAALGIHQLQKAETFRRRRAEMAETYTAAFADLPLRTPLVEDTTTLHAWHLYVIRLDLDRITIDRNRFIELMAKSRIGTSVHFIPLHKHPYWRDTYHLKADDFPVAERVFDEVVSLPLYPSMSDHDQQRVIDAVRAILSESVR
ncbi:MAG: DegT/DnrJ/EryC1/StrS family aminotransferase [Gammaproteobacteria bacterium]|nr:DegT/DnrJ/EryC1/StrS family aminotransferase [Gammaproteobacteria bacterium]MDH3537834.1 DegT/DnrJ/EryC1/StrS family aminotransferase [Gammaproteobacteria bacterium]